MNGDWQDVLSFWFGEHSADRPVDAEISRRWFEKNEAFDGEIRSRFGIELQAVLAGRREHWLATPRGRLAYVIVLDQFSRNIHRDTPAMFAGDKRALAAAREGIEAGHNRTLTDDERGFLYMPFMHSERLEDQERSVNLFRGLSGESYAIAHRDIIARFGRFPHRNAILGRKSTAEELEFLKLPGSSF